MANPKGIHAVRRKLTGGRYRWHFYAWRGGPKFWVDEVREPRDTDFTRALAEVLDRPRTDPTRVPALVDRFLSSAAMPRGARSRADLRKWALRFADHFKSAPAVIFEDRRSRADVNEWRGRWRHSPKQHDAAGTHAVRVLNWSVSEGILREHHCHRLPRLYEVDRSEIVWTAADRAAIEAVAPDWINRILTVACETGLRPGDLCRLSRAHIEVMPHGRRLRVRTAKRKRVATIPVTPELAAVLDATPPARLLILGNAGGAALTPHRASEGLRQWRDKAGLSPELRLQDARGTAATRLLDAGLTLAEIASHMGWSIRRAAQVIEHYARVSPAETNAVLIKLAKARATVSGTNL